MLLIASFGLVVAGMEILGPDRQAASEFTAAAERTGPDMEKSATVGADSAQTIPVEVGVVANRFVLQSNMDGRDLLLAIDTDLPDETEVIVSVGRIYHEVGSDTAYSRDYFSERGSLSEWRKPRRIPIDDDAWTTDLLAHQDKMADLSDELAFEIANIESQVFIRAVVHMNQPDPRFGGGGSPNLSGAAVSQVAGRNDRNVVEVEQNFELPLVGVAPTSATGNVTDDGMTKGKSNRLGRAIRISEADFGKTWPFTVSEGELRCSGIGVVTFKVNNVAYAVNGLAASAGFAPIEPIWKLDRVQNEQIAKALKIAVAEFEAQHGLRINIGPVINAGLDLC